MKLIQITDCHLFASKDGCLKGTNTYQTFISVLDEVKKHRPDLLVISGDLAEDGSIETYLFAKEALEKRGFTYIVLPGNHDNLLNMQTVFGDCFYCDRAQLFQEQLNLVCLNSVVAGKAHGYLSESTLNFLKDTLSKLKTPAIIFVHHHPLPIQHGLMDRYDIQNATQFLEILRPYRHQIQAVVFGHIHQNFTETWEGIPFYGTPSTCIQFKPKCDTLELDENAYPAFREFDFFDPSIDIQPHAQFQSHLHNLHPSKSS